MDWESIFQLLPGVEHPKKKLTLNERLKWTGIILILYFILIEIKVYGISPEIAERFAEWEMLLGARTGSLMTLGIGPIVTASILLQMLVGARIINWDLNTTHGRIMFQGAQKLLAIIITVMEATAWVLFGPIKPAEYTLWNTFMVILQLCIGGWLVIFMDEVVSKWGFGSGISLFIVGGISRQLFIKLFSFESAGEYYAGRLLAFIQMLIQGNPQWVLLVPIITTFLIFIIAVVAQGMRVEIPLAFGTLRGFGRKWPLRFIYTNVIPVILVTALLINIEMTGQMIAHPVEGSLSLRCGPLGCFDEHGRPKSGLVYYITPPYNFMISLIYGSITTRELIRAIIYLLIMIFGTALFSYFWVMTSGMDAKSVAEQIQAASLQIPGFRKDPRVIEKVLDRYITPLAIMGGAFVGFLAAIADLMGALVRGTAILLAVMIVYNMYEMLAVQQLEDAHPLVRKLMSSATRGGK